MPEIGFSLSSEEWGPQQLVDQARMAEEHGFRTAIISDHFHPWIDRQGQSPFVWSVLGGIAQVTRRLRIGTGVTAPIIRIHPTILAQAVATTAATMPGRFFLGVGTGERLNEHVLADRWPEYEVRAAMLEEAVDVMRKLWTGDWVSHYGDFYSVENARLYTLPAERPQVYVAASGTHSAELAGRIGDGLIATTPKKELVQAFDAAGGRGKQKIAQAAVCWGDDEAAAKKTAAEVWPTTAIQGDATQELAIPKQFEALASSVTPDQMGQLLPCGPNVDRHVQSLQEYFDAGFDCVVVHQIGPEQEGFLRFYEQQIVPRFSAVTAGR